MYHQHFYLVLGFAISKIALVSSASSTSFPPVSTTIQPTTAKPYESTRTPWTELPDAAEISGSGSVVGNKDSITDAPSAPPEPTTQFKDSPAEASSGSGNNRKEEEIAYSKFESSEITRSKDEFEEDVIEKIENLSDEPLDNTATENANSSSKETENSGSQIDNLPEDSEESQKTLTSDNQQSRTVADDGDNEQPSRAVEASGSGETDLSRGAYLEAAYISTLFNGEEDIFSASGASGDAEKRRHQTFDGSGRTIDAMKLLGSSRTEVRSRRWRSGKGEELRLRTPDRGSPGIARPGPQENVIRSGRGRSLFTEEGNLEPSFRRRNYRDKATIKEGRDGTQNRKRKRRSCEGPGCPDTRRSDHFLMDTNLRRTAAGRTRSANGDHDRGLGNFRRHDEGSGLEERSRNRESEMK